MFEKFSIEQLYVANYVKETLEYVYSGLFRSISIIHHFNVNSEKEIFVLVNDDKNNFVGYMNLTDGQVYQQINVSLEDYEVTLEEDDIEKIEQAKKVNNGYINFEPLKNYTSRYIKPYMNRKDIKRTIKDINRQIFDAKEEEKTIKFVV